MNDLGMDSLDTVEVVMAFEDEFGELPYCWPANLIWPISTLQLHVVWNP